MMYSEDELIPLSALQHLHFCERQCALIHVEQLWAENLYTAEGRILHERVDQRRRESRGKIRIEYAVSLRSYRLGLIGKADVVEFHLQESGNWLPFPVEYKRGQPKKDDCDKIQLCAQAICLEEMLGVEIMEGALFYGKIRRRVDVMLEDALRRETEAVAVRLHHLVESGKTPKPVYALKCDRCSFFNLCLPKRLNGNRSAMQYIADEIQKV